ncbi:hypothetical protein FANTH_9661 [Fusarium anthophilum]|uniref:Ricin B lectin domain-containing protein n=1 Tax=Fusarium anthophilum TaxID=48485 RepID=A0A8H4Z5I0_9HYPO|nr:hypothetical protein FANTH_9661 [Fusarium anthophilum]
MMNPNDLDGRTVRFINFATGNAMTLDTQEEYPPNGRKVHSWSLINDDNQWWTLEIIAGKGSETPIFVIRSKKAEGKCLDLDHGSSRNGTVITGWQGAKVGEHGLGPDDHQLWHIHTRATWAEKGQIVKIQNHGAWTFVDLYNGGSKNG